MHATPFLPPPPPPSLLLLPSHQQLQEREEEVAELQEEMARGATALEELSAQLEEERLRTNPVAIKSCLQKVICYIIYIIFY